MMDISMPKRVIAVFFSVRLGSEMRIEGERLEANFSWLLSQLET